jgi:sialic acid synthase SpsE
MFRRSIFAIRPIRQGELFTAENTRILRPNVGMQPKRINELFGKVALRDFVPGDPVQSKDVAELD